MNEPLTNSLPGISFPGKTYNKHPQWYNEPLRLTEEQRQDPLPVLDDFFECYHLNDTREILWTWFTEVVSSSRSISMESLDRSNHVYFYEKIEEVIEAVFILVKRIHNHRLRNVPDQATNIQIPGFEIVEKGEILNKPKQLIEFVNDAPIYVIGEVFKNTPLPSLHIHLRDWLSVAVSDDSSIYEDEEQRLQLIAFHEQLLVFVELAFLINTQNLEVDNNNNKNTTPHKTTVLSEEQISTPIPALANFFEKFPITYIIRELNDWLEVGISFVGQYPETMSQVQALHTYRDILCLVKSADRLLKNLKLKACFDGFYW